MAFKLEDFRQEFEPKLGKTIRWKGFSRVAELLANKKDLHIIEIGCMRKEGGWTDDGCSTLVWDWMVERAESKRFTCVDTDRDHIFLAKKHCNALTNWECCRGEAYLSWAPVSDLDLLFLDGQDFFGIQDHRTHACWQSHFDMLLNCYHRLPSGCLILVDDCHNENEGKDVMLRAFLDKIGLKPDLVSNMNLWIKP